MSGESNNNNNNNMEAMLMCDDSTDDDSDNENSNSSKAVPSAKQLTSPSDSMFSIRTPHTTATGDDSTATSSTVQSTSLLSPLSTRTTHGGMQFRPLDQRHQTPSTTKTTTITTVNTPNSQNIRMKPHQRQLSFASPASSHGTGASFNSNDRGFVRPYQPMTTPASSTNSSLSMNANRTNHQTATPSSQSRLPQNDTSASARSKSSAPSANDEAKLKQQRKTMRGLFAKFIMLDLKQTNPPLYQKAQSLLQVARERQAHGQVGYESVTHAMFRLLQPLVGENAWKNAKQRFQEQSQKYQELKRQSTMKQDNRSNSQPNHTQQGSNGAKQQEPQPWKVLAAAKGKAKADTESSQLKTPTTQDDSEQYAVDQLATSNEKKAFSTPSTQTGSQTKSPTGKALAHQLSSSRKRPASSTRGGKGSKRIRSKSPPKRRQATPEREELPPPRVYSRLMKMLDHAVTYDWTSCATLLGQENKADVDLCEEQEKLLYGKGGVLPSADHAVETKQPSFPSTRSSTLEGWHSRNVLSSRCAWAKVRLRERHEHRLAVIAHGKPVVGGVTLPSKNKTAKASTPPPLLPRHVYWYNDEIAAQDKTLALLSEATQLYLKSILEAAVQSAHERQNLDGIRLWHSQHSNKTHDEAPPLCLRLGCDVKRQVAQIEGNAAKTVQRMEEALERQPMPAKERLINQETLYLSSSMANLAMRPQLTESASVQADFHARRRFEIYGGKESGAPPFGRVPKTVAVIGNDFCRGGQSQSSMFPHQRTCVQPFV